MPTTIRLTRGQVAIVDEVDHARLSQYKWYAHYNKPSGQWRACRHVAGTRHEALEMSAELMGARAGLVVDHENRNTLDYRRDNLRWATWQQNCRNRVRANKHLPGVFKNGAGFSARITVAKGVRRCLGWFTTAEAAHEVYKQATKHYFGEFSAYHHAV